MASGSNGDPQAAGMRRVYVRVVVLEVAIIIALWFFGRIFS